MRVRHGILGLVAFGLAVGQVSAQGVNQTSFIFHRPQQQCDSCNAPPSGPVTGIPAQPGTTMPTQPGTTQPGTTQPGQAAPSPAMDSQAFAQAPAAGGEAGGSFNPAMFGDLGASGYAFPATVRSSSSSSGTSGLRGRAPVTATRGSFKISDNDSPRPVDRVFLTLNEFEHIAGTSANLYREVIGFEKTFAGGDASFEARLPFLQETHVSGTGLPSHSVGDLTVLGKYAFINDRETGNVASAGLVLTLPTADHTFSLANGTTFRSVLFQPFGGWIINAGDFYAHGFHSIVVPTTSQDITSIDNDVAVGYWLARNQSGFLRGIVPTIEGHLYTPLNHRNNTEVLYSPNVFTLTGGVNFVLSGNTTIGAALAAPITGPRPNNVEGIVSFNLRF